MVQAFLVMVTWVMFLDSKSEKWFRFVRTTADAAALSSRSWLYWPPLLHFYGSVEPRTDLGRVHNFGPEAIIVSGL